MGKGALARGNLTKNSYSEEIIAFLCTRTCYNKEKEEKRGFQKAVLYCIKLCKHVTLSCQLFPLPLEIPLKSDRVMTRLPLTLCVSQYVDAWIPHEVVLSLLSVRVLQIIVSKFNKFKFQKEKKSNWCSY